MALAGTMHARKPAAAVRNRSAAAGAASARRRRSSLPAIATTAKQPSAVAQRTATANGVVSSVIIAAADIELPAEPPARSDAAIIPPSVTWRLWWTLPTRTPGRSASSTAAQVIWRGPLQRRSANAAAVQMPSTKAASSTTAETK